MLLIQEKSTPWAINISDVEFREITNYNDLYEIELCTFNESISRGLLYSNLEKIKSLKINIKDPSGDVLKKLMDTLTKISCYPEEFQLHLPFDYNEIQSESKRLDYSVDTYIDAIVQIIESIDLDLSSWSLVMDGINDKKIEKLCQMFSILPNLQTLKLSFFQWGLLNAEITGKSVFNICEGIKQIKVNKLYLDLGRWGCKRHDTLNLLDNSHVYALSQYLGLQTQLECLNLNLRSWGYSNQKITNDSLNNLGDALLKLKKLKSLSLSFYMWGYSNQNIKTDGIISFFNIFNHKKNQAFEELSNINLIFKGHLQQTTKNRFQYCFLSSLNILFDTLTSLPKLLRFNLNICGWQELTFQIPEIEQQRIIIDKFYQGINGITLLNCPNLIEFEDMSQNSSDQNIKQYSFVRQKLQVKKNIIKSIQLIKKQNIKKTITNTQSRDNVSQSLETHSENKEYKDLRRYFRKEIIKEFLQEFLV